MRIFTRTSKKKFLILFRVTLDVSVDYHNYTENHVIRIFFYKSYPFIIYTEIHMLSADAFSCLKSQAQNCLVLSVVRRIIPGVILTRLFKAFCQIIWRNLNQFQKSKCITYIYILTSYGCTGFFQNFFFFVQNHLCTTLWIKLNV